MKHPGTITFIDGETVRERPAEELPESLRFAPGPQGLVPVVKVVTLTKGIRRTIREYGPKGELLRSTVQVKSGP